MNVKIFELGVILILAGFIIIAGIVLAILNAKQFKTKVNGGCVILLGPIPLIFSFNKGLRKTLILMLFILFIAFLAIQLLLAWS
jgi:uncharacterized membrane protein